MKKKVKINIVAVLFLFIIFIVFVSALQDSNEIKEEKIEGLEQVKKYDLIRTDLRFESFEIHDYANKNKKFKFKIQIIGFESDARLDSWIMNKVEESASNKTIKGNVIFLDKNKNFVFWRNGTSFIQIINMKSNLSDVDALRESFKPGGSGVFPNSLINKYLEQYPSECSISGCMSKERQLEEKIRMGLLWFFRLPEVIKSLLDYSGDESCPMTQEEWDVLKESPALDAWEIEEIRERCNKYGNYTDKNGLPLPNELKICGRMIDDYLAKNDKLVYKSHITLNECLVRERFLEDNKDLSSEEISVIFEKRNEQVLNEMTENDERKNKIKNKELQERTDKFVEEKIKERNRVHGFNATTNVKTEIKNLPRNNSGKRPLFTHYWFEK